MVAGRGRPVSRLHNDFCLSVFAIVKLKIKKEFATEVTEITEEEKKTMDGVFGPL